MKKLTWKLSLQYILTQLKRLAKADAKKESVVKEKSKLCLDFELKNNF